LPQCGRPRRRPARSSGEGRADPAHPAPVGTYWAAAPAVLTAVPPAAEDRAKDLGVIN